MPPNMSGFLSPVMKKKSPGRPPAKPLFRESDFAGHSRQEQADLSGSLNQLSRQLAESRKLLQEMQATAGLRMPGAPLPDAPPAGPDEPTEP